MPAQRALLEGGLMVLSDVSVKRPVFAAVVSLLIVVSGISALMKLPIREYPDIDPPQVSVEVTYEGAAPEVLDTQIIQVVEGAVAGVEGVSRIESRSRLGSSMPRWNSIWTGTWISPPTTCACPASLISSPKKPKRR